jgi:hypothetical protein
MKKPIGGQSEDGAHSSLHCHAPHTMPASPPFNSPKMVELRTISHVLIAVDEKPRMEMNRKLRFRSQQRTQPRVARVARTLSCCCRPSLSISCASFAVPTISLRSSSSTLSTVGWPMDFIAYDMSTLEMSPNILQRSKQKKWSKEVIAVNAASAARTFPHVRRAPSRGHAA